MTRSPSGAPNGTGATSSDATCAPGGRSVTARGADPDTLVASAKAYLGALNKLTARSQRGKAETERREQEKGKG